MNLGIIHFEPGPLPVAWALAVLSFCGVNFTFWAVVGLVRNVGEKFLGKRKRNVARIRITSARGVDHHAANVLPIRRQSFDWKWLMSLIAWPVMGMRPRLTNELLIELPDQPDLAVTIERVRHMPRMRTTDVAVVIPAHNEETGIRRTIESLLVNIHPQDIFIGSDNSTDRTAEIVRSMGCQVVEIQPNLGKAGVIKFTIDHFLLIERYQAVMIVDADVEIVSEYFHRALPLFDDPEIVAVAGHAVSKWNDHRWPRWSSFFAAYRIRLYRVLQALMRYGQTWRHTNVATIVPGFASLYRTSVLPQIDITAPGMIIEDFNMTFELHHKRLGKIGYDPLAAGVTEDPFRLRDYVRQVKRWDLGFWQTVRHHGIWPSFFWVSLIIFLLELIVFSVILILIPVILVYFILNDFSPLSMSFLSGNIAFQLSWLDLVVGILAVDYLLTILVAAYERKPLLLFYGLGFILLRFIDAFLLLYTLPLAFVTKSTGRWASPQRQQSLFPSTPA